MSGQDEKPEKVEQDLPLTGIEVPLDGIIRRLIENRGKLIIINSCIDCHLSHFTYPNLGPNMRVSCRAASVIMRNNGRNRFIGRFRPMVRGEVPIPEWCRLSDGRDYVGYMMLESVIRQIRDLMPEYTYDR